MTIQVLAGYWGLDLESRELVLCPRSRQMFGLDGRWTKKLPRKEWLPRIHPDDISLIEGELAAAVRENDIYAARFRTVRPDGSSFHILGIGLPLAKSKTRFVGLNFDLAAAAATAELESRRPLGPMARFAGFLRFRPANENTARRRPTFRPGSAGQTKPAPEMWRREALLNRALAAIQGRALRHRFFDSCMLGEPAFDILLALYVTGASPAVLPLRILSATVGVTDSVAARWLKLLVDDGLVLSVAGHGDAGSIQATLTDKGRTILDEYLGALSQIER